MNRQRCLTLSGVITAVGQAPFSLFGQSIVRQERKAMDNYRQGEGFARQGLYDPENEHDNCGIGAVVNISGKQETKVVDEALRIVETLEHRA